MHFRALWLQKRLLHGFYTYLILLLIPCFVLFSHLLHILPPANDAPGLLVVFSLALLLYYCQFSSSWFQRLLWLWQVILLYTNMTDGVRGCNSSQAYLAVASFLDSLLLNFVMGCFRNVWMTVGWSDGIKTVEILMASTCSEQSLSDGDDRLLECAICMDKFIDPCVLPCCHTFCRQCLVQHYECSNWSATAQGADDVNCPTCRQTWPMLAGAYVGQPQLSAAAKYQFNRTGRSEAIPRPSCKSSVSADVSFIVFWSDHYFTAYTDLVPSVFQQSLGSQVIIWATGWLHDWPEWLVA